MRALIVETLLVVVLSVLLVCAALGALPNTDGTTWVCGAVDLASVSAGKAWACRSADFAAAAFTLQFDGARWATPSVLAVMSKAAGFSLLIIGVTTLLLVAVGVPVGIASVTRSRSILVRVVRRAVSMVSSVPVLVLGTVLYVVAGKEFGVTLREDYSVKLAILAAIVSLFLGDRVLADIVQRVEIATRAVLAEPYMRTVRAAGLGMWRHLAQSLVPPIAETLAARSMYLVSGAIVAEYVFFLHGLGFTVHHAISNQENPKKILAAAIALIVVGIGFRLVARSAVLLADARQRVGA